jgi:hypothetical protein
MGPDHIWGPQEQLLATIADALHAANWQRAQGTLRDRPKPIPRPGVEQPRQHGREAVPIDEMRDRLERKRQN